MERLASAFVVLMAWPLAQANAQVPDVQWESTFGGPSSDYGRCVRVVEEGGFIIAGTASLLGRGDAYLIRTDSSGRRIWEKGYGDLSTSANCVEETADGGFIAAGAIHRCREGAFECEDIYLFKTDAAGNLTWSSVLGGDDYDIGYAVLETRDGGYIVAGDGGGSAYLVKTDAFGQKVWEKSWGARVAKSVRQTPDDGYILAGVKTVATDTPFTTDLDLFLMKTDASGELEWERTFGGPYRDEYAAARETSDGGYILVGATFVSLAERTQACLIKTDAGGVKIWERTFGGPLEDYGFAVDETMDGGFVVAGLGDSHSDTVGGYLFRTDAQGNLLWEKSLGGTAVQTLRSVEETADGGVVAAGSTDGYPGPNGDDIYLVKVAAPFLVPRGQLRVPASFTASESATIVVSLRARDEVRAFSFGLSHDPEVAEVESVAQGCDLEAAGGADYFNADLSPAACSDGRTGTTLAAIMSLDQPPRTLPSGLSHQVAELEFLEKRSGETTLSLVNCLGDPPVDLIVTGSQGSIEPDVRGGFLRFRHRLFVRGDVDADGKVNISDVVKLLYYLFGEEDVLCLAACDVDGRDEEVLINDPVYLLLYLFAGGSRPPEPFSACGEDSGLLICGAFPSCS